MYIIRHDILSKGLMLERFSQSLSKAPTCRAAVGVQVEEGLLGAVALQAEEAHVRVPHVLVARRLDRHPEQLVRQLHACRKLLSLGLQQR